MQIKQIQKIKPTEISFAQPVEDKKEEQKPKEPTITEESNEDEEEGGMKGRYEDFIGIYENAVPDEFCDDVRKALDYYVANDSLHIGDDQFPNSCAGRFDYSIDLYHMSSTVEGRADRDLNQYIFECFAEYAHVFGHLKPCLLYTSPSPRDATLSRMPSSA